MVPRGRLELPLLAKTDFESAASTNSAIRAQWRRSIEMRLPSVNQVHREFLIFPLDFSALLDEPHHARC